MVRRNLMEKMCSWCKCIKPIDQFRWLNKQNRYIAYCKECEKEYDRAYQRVRYANKKLKENGEKI